MRPRIVLLTLLDCVYEFLWAAAIGGLLYKAKPAKAVR